MTTRHLGWEHVCDRCGQQVTTSSDDRPEGWLTLAIVLVSTEQPVIKTICHACSKDFDLWCKS